jgi:hypothetical protein
MDDHFPQLVIGESTGHSNTMNCGDRRARGSDAEKQLERRGKNSLTCSTASRSGDRGRWPLSTADLMEITGVRFYDFEHRSERSRPPTPKTYTRCLPFGE